MNRWTRGLAVGAAAAVAAATPSALAQNPDDPVKRPPPPPPGGYECPLPPEQSGIPELPASDNPFDARGLKGLRMPEAKRVAAKHDCSVRVVRRDGENLAVTEDYSPQRINVGVRDGLIRRIHGIF